LTKNLQKDPGQVDRIKELEKELQDNKNYYISKMTSLKPDDSEEIKHLREEVLNYEKIIEKMKNNEKFVLPNLFPFLSSETGGIWCRICQEVSQLNSHITQKSSKHLITILEKIIEILESSSESPNFASYASFDKILEKTLALSSLLRGIPN
jgi:hypothetical protein